MGVVILGPALSRSLSCGKVYASKCFVRGRSKMFEFHHDTVRASQQQPFRSLSLSPTPAAYTERRFSSSRLAVTHLRKFTDTTSVAGGLYQISVVPNPTEEPKTFPQKYAIMLLLVSSGFLAFWCQPDQEKAGEDRGNTFPKTLLNSCKFVMSRFVVEAAKPLNEKGAQENQPPDMGGKGNRRQHFNFIADVLEIVKDAVVCIEVKDHSNANWFGMPQPSSNGSGFIVREDGLILTNAHVVATQKRNSITVRLTDGRCFAGFVEHVDYESDLATVRVKARGLPTLKLGCSAETRVGEWVIAVGSPLSLSNTVTAGIVSSTSRGASEIGIRNDINYIQTDAAITFGNSGGPLCDLNGEAIGINSMKVTPGISFAIPIDHAKKFLEQADMKRAAGNVGSSRRYMGLTILSLTDPIRVELEARTGMRVPTQGVFVWQVVRGGPAYLSGLHPGDIITSINGEPMRSAAQVHEIIKTDDTLTVEVQRAGRKFVFNVVPENVVD